MPENPAIILRVALPVPLPGLYDYLPPLEGQGELGPGVRVRVPFGRRQWVGMIVSLAQESDQEPDRLKPVLALLDQRPLLGADDLELILWAADYYRQPPGEALFSALPVRLRQGKPVLAPPEPRDLTDAALPAVRLADAAPAAGPDLNSYQSAAVQAVQAALGRFRPFLLQGVTGSGKTEVYIRLLEAVQAAGGQALLLVPEIGLTPQLRQRLERRLSGRLVTLHSGLTARERELAWQAAAQGRADLVLGTRSAVFVPLPRLRLILVDEEHDLSFKQQEGFRYSARDLAVWRAQRAACPLVLGSATPSLESLRNVEIGRYVRLVLPERAGAAAPPDIRLLDIRSQPLRAGLSAVMIRLMREQFDAGNQVLLFLNRRGFAPVLSCHGCGWVAACPRCDARLTLHLADHRLWCHHCGLTKVIPPACPQCGGLDIRALGQGTERLEGELQALFPDIQVARVDRDSTRRKGELDRLLAGAHAGHYPLLVGTQMLAKGHHFPGVTLVGILDVDNGLYGCDFRAPERMAQLVIQVAGRAGRAERPGWVVLQTHHPDHPLLQTLRRQGYQAFAAIALRERREAGLPPFTHQALLRVESPSRELSLDWLQRAREAGLSLAAEGLSFFGPVPAPMERRADRYRAQLLVQSPGRAGMRAFLAAWVPRLYGIKPQRGARWSIDVDPQEMF